MLLTFFFTRPGMCVCMQQGSIWRVLVEIVCVCALGHLDILLQKASTQFVG